ncbi:hypothetical protein DUI87_23502 [Hirundo rustica rustica]|uniref:Uncharacterized protein n=1 Tax=Hirundo rustica rustica TaxID=333673 RepID=A0A3M0JGC9_HIRRU|nr:hypothetical protein DUI87_23502 [Hirundo rustica rustica]
MHLESLSLNHCWCQVATLRMKVKNTESAKNAAVCGSREQSAILKAVLILQAQSWYQEWLPNTTELCETQAAGRKIGVPILDSPATKSNSFLTNWDISFPECSDVAGASIEEKTPMVSNATKSWYESSI